MDGETIIIVKLRVLFFFGGENQITDSSDADGGAP